jgi:hypothetical protein
LPKHLWFDTPAVASSSPGDRSYALIIDERHIAYVRVAGWMNLKALALSE